MSYFSTNYGRINYPVATEMAKGLRNAQLGAIYAIGAHFTVNQNEPALVVMPTGSGKTAVLNLTAYMLRAKRVLVISSSVMVRGQIFEEFATLKTLKASNVFFAELPAPAVKEIKSPIKSFEEWNSLRDFDVVIGIPNSINEGINEAFRPPNDLFDLILVDEAHHVPAFTWTNVVKAFPASKKVYFTATPFRRDKKEIEGRLAYVYSISKAYEDKIFGDIGYYPVTPKDNNIDLSIALETERIFQIDQEAGLHHYIMVRTETKDHASELATLYANQTFLRLKKIDSTVSYSSIKKTIQNLKDGLLDGVICVDMLGEGFDFPNLKIAAIHSPKKSLANTLQFIGRFARTNAENIGEAKFLAIPSDIEIGKKKLYEEGAIWNDIIRNLSEEVIDEQDEIKKVLDTFEKEKTDSPIKDDISFYNLNPYCHVKIYSTEGIDLNGIIEAGGHEILYHAISREHNAIVFVTKEIERPKWLLTDDLINVKHFLFLVYYDLETKLLFIHSSIKTVQFYDELVEIFAVGEYKRISKYQINKVLIDISDAEFFNIGMQNRSANSGESYRIIAGSNAETTIRKSHTKNYANGHVFMKGKAEGEKITVGYSSGSKVWSNAYQKIPTFIKWCSVLAKKIVSDREVKTNTGFDNLPIGKVVNNFQLPAHSATWNHATFSEWPLFYQMQEDEIVLTAQLLDFGIQIKKEDSDLYQLMIDLELDDLIIPLSYDFTHHFRFREHQAYTYLIEISGQNIDLIAYLNDSPFQIFLDDFATIVNHEFYGSPAEADYQFSAEKILSFDWNAANTDIEKEYYDNGQDKINNGNKNSIHETLRASLVAQNYDILIYDHGKGEVADFIAIKESGDKIKINLYHVKASSGEKVGDRVGDLYEVCMQAVKSQVWTTSKHHFREKLLSRTYQRDDKFISGDRTAFTTLINKSKMAEFTFTIVQPGISAATFSPKLSYILAATDDYLINNGYESLIPIGS